MIRAATAPPAASERPVGVRDRTQAALVALGRDGVG